MPTNIMFPILDNSTVQSLHHLNTIVLNPSVKWLTVLFRGLAIALLAPIIFLTALDIAAYLIARTVGTPHHRSSHLVGVPIRGTSDTTQKLHQQHQNPKIIISEPATLDMCAFQKAAAHHHLPTPPSSGEPSPSPPHFPTHFTTASEGNFALAGEGVFSPPESRAGSPSLDRQSKMYRTRKRAASVGVEALGAITDSTNSEEDDTDSTSSASFSGEPRLGATGVPAAAPLRKRKPGLQFTPLN